MNKEEREIAKKAVMKYRMANTRKFITSESREKARLARIGLKRSEESKEKMRLKALGRKHSPETIQKIREARHKQEISKSMLEALADNRGDKSVLWKGEDVGYRALHRWVENHRGKPTTCEFCEKKNLIGHNIHWANKSGEYKRDLEDWLRLCALCHKRHDKELKQLSD